VQHTLLSGQYAPILILAAIFWHEDSQNDISTDNLYPSTPSMTVNNALATAIKSVLSAKPYQPPISPNTTTTPYELVQHLPH
jgi:hypothetical protein